MDQTSQELPMAFSWAEEMEAAGVVTTGKATSGEAQPASGASVSGDSGEATSDRGSQSAPEPAVKRKRHRGRNAPSDIRRRIDHGQKFREVEAEHAVSSAKFFNECQE